MWFGAADCLVYFYTEKTSQRGASLRLPFEAIQKLGCTYLLERCLRTRKTYDNGYSERAYTRLRNDSDPQTITHELYIAAPTGVTREQAFAYHLTTRNLLAYAVGAPLVGEKLSIALIDLWRRIQLWKLTIRAADFTSYLEKQGYLDFTENTEHALACLKFTEEARLRDIWIDSFVHCVGMHSRLDLSPEFAGLNKGTAALITRASLEMDLNIGRVIRAVGSFLEEDFGLENLGLTKPSRDHLDYFRSFLHCFYVNKFGYFPPGVTNPWNKRPWQNMHSDFQHLYDYLADVKSSGDWTMNQNLAGGICVIQNVQSFDVRHGYPALQHPLPLLPEVPSKSKSSSGAQKGLRPLARVRFGYAAEPKITANQRLLAATNASKTAAMSRCSLVQEYQRFEREVSESKLDLAEARKVRWLLIYGVLQMLNNVIKGPAEVRDPETASYPLCVSTVGCPPWENEPVGRQPESAGPPQRSNEKMLMIPEALDNLEGRESRISIHPDCEADCAEDFFASLGVTRQDSARSFSTPASPLKRTASLRNSMHFGVQALQKSVVGSLSRRSSQRASLLLDVKKSRSLCEILVEDGKHKDASVDEPTSATSEINPCTFSPSLVSNQWDAFDFGFAPEQGTYAEQVQPETDHESMRTARNSPLEALASPCDSNFTASSDESSNNSNRSSYIAEPIESPTTDLSSWDGGSRRGSIASDSTVHMEPKKQQLTYQPSNPNLRQKGGHVSIHSGHYVPKGMVSKSASTGSESSADILVASAKPTTSVIARERKIRHRRKSSGLDSLTGYGIVLSRNVC